MFKVVCINNEWNNPRAKKLKVGGVYEVVGIDYPPPPSKHQNDPHYDLKGIPCSCYHNKHFRPYEDDFSSQIAEQIEEEINQEELVLINK